MKKSIILLLSIFWFQQAIAQQSPQQKLLAQLLDNYYSTRDALFSGNSAAAARAAGEFIRTANGIDYKIISEGNINALLEDASAISETGDIQVQRRRLANLSENLATIAKALRLSDKPIYIMHCSMKKASWLSPVKEVQNPYYGSAMPGCGSLVETINQ